MVSIAMTTRMVANRRPGRHTTDDNDSDDDLADHDDDEE